MNAIRWVLLAFLGMLLTVISFYFLAILDYWHIPPISFQKVESVRTRLVDGIESYQSVEQIEKYLKARSLKYSKKSLDPSSGTRPPSRMDIITVYDFRHLGTKGELVLQLFNDRLMETLFFPSDVSTYLVQLEADGIRIAHNKQVKFDKYTLVCAGQNSEGREFVTWQDKRLTNEMDLWVKGYS